MRMGGRYRSLFDLVPSVDGIPKLFELKIPTAQTLDESWKIASRVSMKTKRYTRRVFPISWVSLHCRT